MVPYVRSKIHSEHQEDFPIHYHEAKVVANLRPYFQDLKTQQVEFFVVPKKHGNQCHLKPQEIRPYERTRLLYNHGLPIGGGGVG